MTPAGSRIGAGSARRVGGRTRLIVVLASVAILAAACGSDTKTTTGSSSGSGVSGGVFRIPIGEPKAIDPFNARDSEGLDISRSVFVGLVTFDGNAELKMLPGVAETWAPNDACTEWTFHLRDSKFSNGEPVDAASFIRGWTRSADAKSASQVSYHLAGIDGYDALHGDPQTATTFSGLSAPDPKTLVVRLNSADCEFDRKTLVAPMSPVPEGAGAADNQVFNEAPIGNGPFMIKPGTKWEHNQSITLVRNDTYFGPKPHLDEIDFIIFPAQGRLEAEYRAFTAGDADFARIPPTLFRQAKSTYEPQGSFFKYEAFGINYLVTNDAKGVMTNPDARRAVSLALDRDAIAEGVYQGSLTTASAILSPPFGAFFQEGVCDVCTYDVTKAKDLAGKAGLTPGTHIKLLYNNDGGHEAFVQAVQNQLQTNLGVVVDLDGVPFAESLAKQDAGDFDLARSAWTADYPTPDAVLYPLLASTSADNTSKYSNPAFDDLILKARATKDAGERQALIKQAEKLAIGTDVGDIPMFNRTQYRVFDSKKWTGVALDYTESATFATISLKS
ncbi:MAG: oligopeptide transport system substrate-binding protein [Actinomycetota bacterium]|jgi:ABC-type oligopeptide transport system substrate-binding subunit|nr:oligopeptide transport system substrate-binding protein [Actinomycetota bacterium]